MQSMTENTIVFAVVGEVTRLHGMNDRAFDYRHVQDTFLVSETSRPALVSTQPHIRWVPGRSRG